MGYESLREAVVDLEKQGELVRLEERLDPFLEMAEVQRRIYARGGPAVLFQNVKGSAFPCVSNLFGTKKRAEYLFRDTLSHVRALVAAKVDPASLAFSPLLATKLPFAALHLLPKTVKKGPVLDRAGSISELPQIVSWPGDGGPFVTLPQVFTEDPESPGLRSCNIGMYRVQLGGNRYEADREIGLHYQIHRGIGVHHQKAIRKGEPLRVRIFVGGPPAFTLAAVMPLPEGLPELSFAGALNGRAARMIAGAPHIHADADFCITGTVHGDERKPEGPFGDHLGYYAKTHDFPLLRVESVTHRKDAIWPFTVVGRPPQEDTVFGELIHDLTASLVPNVLPGVREVHAVDEAGVHPLLLAVGSERYTPYAKDDEPAELLTQSNAILGQGQMSLAKYLLIADEADRPPPLSDVRGFFRHVLERFEPARDLHFHVKTTIDTLDYSGTALNKGSKVVIAARGKKKRVLAEAVPEALGNHPRVRRAALVAPGIVAVETSPFVSPQEIDELGDALLGITKELSGVPLLVVVDDAAFTAKSFANFLWVTFTRSNPAVDVHGVGAFVENKAWGSRGPLLVDARSKPHHAPPLVENPEVTERVDRLFVRGGPLGRWG
jgi:4-hydroxy-3-polyprenylbenzoate decarboxylase